MHRILAATLVASAVAGFVLAIGTRSDAVREYAWRVLGSLGLLLAIWVLLCL